MGHFDDAVRCPECGTWGAKKSLFKVKCINPGCRRYDAERAEAFQQNRVAGKSAREVFPHLKGKADPNEYTLPIRYQNFRGDEIVYSADPTTGYQKGAHAVFRLAPTGRRVTFKLDKVQNRSEVDARLAENQREKEREGPQPTGRERRVLKYHLRKGTTSALFEELRQKYPNFQD